MWRQGRRRLRQVSHERPNRSAYRWVGDGAVVARALARAGCLALGYTEQNEIPCVSLLHTRYELWFTIQGSWRLSRFIASPPMPSKSASDSIDARGESSGARAPPITCTSA